MLEMMEKARMCPSVPGVTQRLSWNMSSSTLSAFTTNSLALTETTMSKSGGTRLKKVGRICFWFVLSEFRIIPSFKFLLTEPTSTFCPLCSQPYKQICCQWTAVMDLGCLLGESESCFYHNWEEVLLLYGLFIWLFIAFVSNERAPSAYVTLTAVKAKSPFYHWKWTQAFIIFYLLGRSSGGH